MVHEVIDEHADVFLVPREFVRVELRNVEFKFLIAVIAGVIAVGRVFGAVCPVVCTVDFVFAIDCFDDVYFAAGGPSDCVEVFAEHPECRPDSLAGRECNARFYRAVLERKFALGKHAGGGVLLTFVVFFLGADVQDAVFDIGVFLAVGVVFPFVVAPAACARSDFESPFACVNCLAVEFIMPEVLCGGFSAARRNYFNAA